MINQQKTEASVTTQLEHSERVSAVINKIREECPCLMELSFGCEILYHNLFGHPIVDKIIKVQDNKYYGKELVCIGKTIHREKVFEIIGKPPTLSDLLYTIGRVGNEIDIDEAGNFTQDRNYKADYDYSKSLLENLEQNEELTNFIHQLLCK